MENKSPTWTGGGGTIGRRTQRKLQRSNDKTDRIHKLGTQIVQHKYKILDPLRADGTSAAAAGPKADWGRSSRTPLETQEGGALWLIPTMSE